MLEDSDRYSDTSHVHAVFELSKRVRACSVLCAILIGLLGVVLFLHKPAVGDRDLETAIFSANFARQLHGEHERKITDSFNKNINTFDYPWNEIASKYIRETDGDARSKYLSSFLNYSEKGRLKHLFSVLEDVPEVGRDVNEYLEDSKNRWQTFVVPLLVVEVSRDEVAFYIIIMICIVHVFLLLKIDYLNLVRERHELHELPDPSLLTATVADLAGYGRSEKRLVLICQFALAVLVPWAVFLGVVLYIWRYCDFNIGHHKRLSLAGGGLLVNGIFAVFIVWLRWKRIVTSWKEAGFQSSNYS